jgi:biotin carboxylase
MDGPAIEFMFHNGSFEELAGQLLALSVAPAELKRAAPRELRARIERRHAAEHRGVPVYERIETSRYRTRGADR